MAKTEVPDIWLQEYEATGLLSGCGCRIESAGPKDEPGAAFYQCELHRAAKDLLAKVALYADEEGARIDELENMDDPPEDVADMIGHHKHLLAELDALINRARGRTHEKKS